MGELVGENSHPLWIIHCVPDVPIDSACRALHPLIARPSRAYAVESRYPVALHVLAVCEGMSSGASILIVGAEDVLHRTVVAALRAKGFECESASRVEDGKRKLESGAYEVAVVNLDAPGAFDLLPAHGGDGLPVSVIAITERPAVTMAVQAFRAGVVDYLAKPIQRDALLAAVERAVERARALRSLHGIQQLLGACTRWFRDVETLLRVPGAWSLPPAIRTALTEDRQTRALDQVLIQCLGAHEVAALTRREREVLLAMAQGQRGRDLARCLGVSVNTCRTHTKAVLRKLGCHSQRELIDRLGGTSHVE